MTDYRILGLDSTGKTGPVRPADVAVVAQVDNPSAALKVGENASSVQIGGASNTVTIPGDLVVQGTQTSVNSTTVDIADRVIHVNHSNGANDPVPVALTGLSVHRGAVSSVARDHAGIFWDENDGYWKFAYDAGGDDATLGSWLSVAVGGLDVHGDYYGNGPTFTHSGSGNVLIESNGASASVKLAAVGATSSMILDARGSFTLWNNGTPVLSSDMSSSVTVEAGITLGATGTGNIDLPNNIDARFKIAGSAVSENVTATNLSQLTGGGATTLHTHAASAAADQLTMSGQTISALASGDIGYLSGNNTHGKAVSSDAAKVRVSGIKSGSSLVTGHGSKVVVNYTGADPGNGPVYLSSTAGKCTTAVPAKDSGEYLVYIGECVDNTNYAGGTIVVDFMPERPVGPM